MGFEWSLLGEGSYVVRAVPAIVADTRASAMFEAALGALEKDPDAALDAAVTAVAGAGATPNGESLEEEDARRRRADSILARDGASTSAGTGATGPPDVAGCRIDSTIRHR